MKAPSLPLAYLVSQYPTTNHTYLLREIRGLRAAGRDVAVLSIRGPDRAVSGLSGEELSEFQSTFYVLGGGLAAAAGAHLPVKSPAGSCFSMKRWWRSTACGKSGPVIFTFTTLLRWDCWRTSSAG